ncbi:MAG: hypothetical protein QOG64_2769 [Acidimicrobiaceae bacterium]|nr:hypothetical protein [Acidimicrobiaceae bacterium]
MRRADEEATKRFAAYRRAGLDRTLLPVSRVANHGVLWAVVAALLGLTGGRFGRRAALRGAVSAIATSAIVNGPVKWGVRRRRPEHESRLAKVTGRRRPRTPSFPSGHAAVAAAFAVGAGMELPAVAAPLGAVAAGVGAGRVYDGLHYPGDVAGGAAIGTVVALATRRWWPVAPHHPARIGSRLRHVAAEPSPTGKGLTIVVNPSAGSGHALNGSPAEELRQALPDADIVALAEGDDLGEALEQAAGEALAIGVAGGDGSINTGAAVAQRHDKPLVVVPAGTLNHLARDLGLETVADAIRGIKEGAAVAVDVGEIDGKPFLNTASFGSYVDLVDARERLERKIGKWPAVFVALWRVLRQSEPVLVDLDGRPRRIWMIFIGNCAYHPAGFAPSWRERLDDGQLDVRIVDATSPLARTRLLTAVLTGRLGRCRVYQQQLATSLAVRSRQGSLRLARDGETFDGSEEFTVGKCEKPLLIYRP